MAWYSHQESGTEVTSIAGHYKILEEGRMTYGNREFIYVMGGAMVDSSCCGPAGCRFVQVHGYIISWKQHTDANGLPVSEVERIPDPEAQEIRCFLAGKFPHAQIVISTDT